MSLHAEPYQCRKCGAVQDKPWQGVMCQATPGCNGTMVPWYPGEVEVETQEYAPGDDFIGAATEAPGPLPPDTYPTILVPNPRNLRMEEELRISEHWARPDVCSMTGRLAPEETKNVLPEDSAARKEIPLCTGLLDYFPDALAYVARISKIGNDKHNPGQPLHHARGKSMDHPDCIARHLIDRGRFDKDGIRHTGYLAWRALAELQEELEAAGAPLARGARVA